jgi:hypothetical protein
MKIREITTVSKTKTITKCPKCGNNNCEGIPIGKLFKLLLFFLDIKRYKCCRCFEGFYKYA